MGARNTKNAALARLPGRTAALCPASAPYEVMAKRGHGQAATAKKDFHNSSLWNLPPHRFIADWHGRSSEQMVSICRRPYRPAREIPRSLWCYDPSEANSGGNA
jgi:hypothetical protein